MTSLGYDEVILDDFGNVAGRIGVALQKKVGRFMV
jgi:hypothetical protein